MVRFSMNQWSGFVLTLCLCTASFCLLGMSAPSVALAGGGLLLQASDDTGGSAGGYLGDPDVPMGPGDGKTARTAKYPGKAKPGVSVQEARCAGDVTVTGSVVMNHLRLVLLSLRGLHLGF